MEEREIDSESSVHRIKQLEHERDELRKDIEQLCMQQAGPSYLAVATRMHFQRTAGLEQEIEHLKKKLAICTRENRNLQEELSEVYRIKSQLADLHSVELSKNMEAEKQLKFFQSCVAAAFAERDNSLMEAEKAKEREEAVSQKLNDIQQRLDDLTAEFFEEKKRSSDLQVEAVKLQKLSDISERLINKFYVIRQASLGCFEDRNVEEKCTHLLDDPPEMWIFDCHSETSTSKYIASLEEELKTLRNSMENLHNKLRMGLEIEEHLRKKVSTMEKKHILSDEMIRNGLSTLRWLHSQHRSEVVNLLEEEKTRIKSLFDEANEKIKQLHIGRMHNFEALKGDSICDDIECRDVHITNDVSPSAAAKHNSLASSSKVDGRMIDTSDALAQALQEKVATLLLLSQQEERHFLERDVNAALQKKIDELQRNLFQVTNEKVMALVELAQLRQDYQILQENIRHGVKQGNSFAKAGDKSIVFHERDGKLKSLLKRTALRRWVGRFDLMGNESGVLMNNDESGSINKKIDFPVEIARLKIENANLQESVASMEHLTSSIHKLRLSLLKARDTATLQSPVNTLTKALDNIIFEAKLVKTALGSSLPLSWSAEGDPGSVIRNLDGSTDSLEDSTSGKVDYVSAAGFEMVELLILAAHLLKENVIGKSCQAD
eukprot:TRINITY_DN8997_c0_g1_i1.p1 TRINITY_DN8997_c0_g1~~TRINITY_DN8997_c0_g1_i1.p1  ORF type:complete len:662 (+),score=161.46 TRINITY_DN8997_c0_g1_i1:268-2253(+)